MKLVGLLLGCLLSIASAHAQVVTLPIPGSPLSLNVMANPQPLQNINNNPAATQYQLWDDGYANVPLPFTFPFFDRTFNNSTMYSNGAVQFGPHVPANNTFCCNGITIDRNTPSAYNYSILMMQTDMYGSTGNNHYSLGTSNTMTYGWYNVERLGDPTNKTSFELKIDSTGGIDMRWTGALISWNTPAIGVIGDASKGEFAVIQQGGLNQNFNIPGLTQVTTGQTPDIVIDPCTSNPLYSPTCSGYQAAYTQQQCSVNPLYSTACSGYQAAYTQQQCSINPLYSTTCSGYQAAYNEQQCSLNPLYSTTCSGYAAAYLQQQCTANPLYSTTCDGYAAAYKTQQCTANPLYATDCPGYATAYKTQQCSLNALYATDCPGYEQAYLNAQCIIDSLYSRLCEGYATAYAIKNLVKFSDSTVSSSVNQSLSDTAATKANDPANTIVPTTVATTTVSSDGTVSTGVSTTGDTNVDKAIAPKTASASASPSAPVQLSAPAAAPMAQRQEEKKSEGKSETKAEGKSDGGGQQQAQNNKQGGDSKPAAPTARQELQAKREAAAKAEAVEKGKNLANEMGKAADMEAQKQIQNVVIQAMGFTPGFDSYGKVMMNDTVGYKPFSIYNNQKNIDNRANLRMFGGTDRLHSQMVESQYKKED
jgi:ribosomal protein L12E/L44/L45/RPP1/RPP2